MIKKVISGALAAAILSVGVVSAETAEYSVIKNAFGVKVNGNYLTADNYFVGNALYVPLRAVFETMGSNVIWDDGARSIKITANGEKSTQYVGEYNPTLSDSSNETLYTDSVILSVDDKYITADTFILNDRTYINFSSLEGITAHTYYSPATMTVRIYSDDYKTLGDDVAAVYGDGKTVNYTQFFDISKFIYGDLKTASQNYFSEVDSYLLINDSLGKLANELNADVTDDEVKAFSEKNSVESKMEKAEITDKEYLQNNYIKDYALSEKIFNNAADLKEVTDEEMQSYYDGLNESKGLWIKAQHILIQKGENGEGLKKAQQLLEEVKKPGADFAKIMLENSQDPGSISNPDGYIFTKGQMVDEFYEGALNLKEGEISDIVETNFGYHIIKKIKQWDNGIPMSDIEKEIKAACNNNYFETKLKQNIIESDVFFNESDIIKKANEIIENKDK